MNENTKAVDVLADERLCHCCGEPFVRCRETYRGTSAAVDALAAYDRAMSVCNDDITDTSEVADVFDELREARAAVAELMKAAGKAQDTNRDDYVLRRPDVSHMAPELRAYFLAGWGAASEAVYQTGLRAALARVGGAK